VAYVTANYALLEIGRLSAGERVLIHSAASPVGLAAVQVAQAAGAEVFATAEQLLERTNGRGADVILNSLPGANIPSISSTLAKHGRFLELTHPHAHPTSRVPPELFRPTELFRKAATFSIVDIDGLIEDSPGKIEGLLAKSLEHAHPLPLTAFPASQIADALRAAADSGLIGKIVVEMQDPAAKISPRALFRADATYLITGGTGGIGLRLAQWMVEQGARHLVLTSRNGGPMPVIDATVRLEQVDVADRDRMAALLADIDRTMPPLRGVFHCAVVLDDGLLLHLNDDRFEKVMAPKVAGAWNLHALTLGRELDHLVLFSSAASILGSPAQGNYAAANAYLDALAHYRHAQSLPALSVNWGPWAEVGQAARADRGGRLELRGVASLAPAQALEALDYLLRHDVTQAAVVRLDIRQWRQFYPKAAQSPLLEELMRDGERPHNVDAPMRRALEAADARRRIPMLESHLLDQLGQVLRLPVSRIDRETPLKALGLDSLMALELRNRLETSLGLRLSATLLWSYPTVPALAEHLAGKLDFGVTEAPATPAPQDTVEVEVAQLSPAEALAQLEAELAEL
jgi:NADPH:quinone reductase-like Zn-dependent oxidoreductase/acyl carrier protein